MAAGMLYIAWITLALATLFTRHSSDSLFLFMLWVGWKYFVFNILKVKKLFSLNMIDNKIFLMNMKSQLWFQVLSYSSNLIDQDIN